MTITLTELLLSLLFGTLLWSTMKIQVIPSLLDAINIIINLTVTPVRLILHKLSKITVIKGRDKGGN